jgi:hypothetical protein
MWYRCRVLSLKQEDIKVSRIQRKQLERQRLLPDAAQESAQQPEVLPVPSHDGQNSRELDECQYHGAIPRESDSLRWMCMDKALDSSAKISLSQTPPTK